MVNIGQPQACAGVLSSGYFAPRRSASGPGSGVRLRPAAGTRPADSRPRGAGDQVQCGPAAAHDDHAPTGERPGPYLMVFPTIHGASGEGPVFAELPDVRLSLIGTTVIDNRLVRLGVGERLSAGRGRSASPVSR